MSRFCLPYMSTIPCEVVDDMKMARYKYAENVRRNDWFVEIA